MSDHGAFMGYARTNGPAGVRNLVAIIPSVGCSNHAAQLIAQQVPGSVLVSYNEGCGETETDTEMHVQLLSQYGLHPNVYASIVVSLGCEGLDAKDLHQRILSGGGRSELIIIQEEGGTRSAVAKGVQLAHQFAAEARRQERVPCPMSDLTFGLECGGSDATSGLAANPSVGAFSDLMVAEGSKVILAETSELLGAEHVMRDRALTPEIAAELMATVDACETFLKSTGEDFVGKQPAPGNIVGGITTVEEKALGDIRKAGSTPFVEVLAYGEIPTVPGLSFMDTPGNDLASVTALVAGGSQIVVFTTGRGNPMGNAIAPVIKLTGNTGTFERMRDDMDLNAGTVIGGEETVEQVGARIMALAIKVAEGEITAAEALGHAEFGLLRYGPVY